MKMKKSLFVVICTVTMMSALCIAASADMGPKPSVRISFCGIGDEVCYATLLSKNSSTGPSSAWDGDEDHAYHQETSEYYGMPYEIWRAFVDYEDSDGYYFLQEGWIVTDEKPLAWTYYPPSSFKVLLYFPERGIFISSGIYERYAFDSYFAMDITEYSPFGGELGLTVTDVPIEKSYDYTAETVWLIARIVITIAVELIVALLFGLWHKGQMLTILIVNAVTQIALNILLNAVNYSSGRLAFLFMYLNLEVFVIIAEAILYCIFINRASDVKRRKIWFVIYAIVANIASMLAGMGDSSFIEMIL